MTMATRIAVVVGLIAVVAIAGCGSAAATSKPTAAPTAAATLPGEAPGGSGGGPFPTVGFAHDDLSLETLLPTTVNGVTLIHMSTDAVDELSGDAAGQAMTAFLQSQGKQPVDMKIAEAFDPNGLAGVTVVLFRVPGIDAGAVRTAMVTAGLFVPKTATPPPGVPAAATLGGKQVVAIPQGSNVDYLYAKGDVLYDVRTGDPNLAATVLGGLP
jgi:hypothetical protein